MVKARKSQKTKTRISLTEKQLSEAKQIARQSLADDPTIFDLPESKRTVDDITNFFIKIKEGENIQRLLPKEKRRYVVYLRKSTDDETKQVRSLEDQEVECRALARQMGVIIREEDIIKESASAKKSGNRPLFDQMILGFKTGKYQGLLAWSPDRLSRNMKEAGEIIEMLDSGEIQDLQFKTYAFDNSPNGKMMLGILFATSKQYSDKLSVDVIRGIKGNTQDGKYNGVIKKGYFADSQSGLFIPDAHNWQLLRRGVIMRLKERKTNQEIADYLNDAHFSIRRYETDKYKTVKMTKKIIGDIFADPFYCGAYKYGDNITNLNDQYNFMPLVTPDEFIALNRNMASDFNEEFIGRSTISQRLDFGILRGKVICDYCDKVMSFQRTKIKKGKNAGSWLISFYCRNKDCIRHNHDLAIEKYGHKLSKSIRLKYLTAHIEWTLRHLTKNTIEAHKLYVDQLKQQVAIERNITKRKLADARAEFRRHNDLYAKYQQLQVESPDDYKRHHKGKLEYHQEAMIQNKAMIAKLEQDLQQLSNKLPTHQEFVELVNSYLKTILSTTDIIEEDMIYNKLVLNLRAGDNAVSVIKLNPPYNLMVDLEKISLGWG